MHEVFQTDMKSLRKISDFLAKESILCPIFLVSSEVYDIVSLEKQSGWRSWRLICRYMSYSQKGRNNRL